MAKIEQQNVRISRLGYGIVETLDLSVQQHNHSLRLVIDKDAWRNGQVQEIRLWTKGGLDLSVTGPTKQVMLSYPLGKATGRIHLRLSTFEDGKILYTDGTVEISDDYTHVQWQDPAPAK